MKPELEPAELKCAPRALAAVDVVPEITWRRPRRSSSLRNLRTLSTTLIWVVALRPQALGGTALYIVVRGNSMLPTYDTGDLLIVRPAADYAVGDVVAYRVPDGQLGEGRIVVHRIIGGDAADGFVLRGDNNPAPDPWSPRAGDIAGTPWVAVPTVGRLIAWLHQPVVPGASRPR